MSIRAFLLVTELVVVGAEPPAAKPTRIGFLTYTEKKHNEHVTFSVIISVTDVTLTSMYPHVPIPGGSII